MIDESVKILINLRKHKLSDQSFFQDLEREKKHYSKLQTSKERMNLCLYTEISKIKQKIFRSGLGKRPVGDISVQRIVRSGKWRFGEFVRRGKFRRGIVRRGNVR